MAKYIFSSILFFFVLSCTLFGQKPNATPIKIEAPQMQIVAEVNGDKITRSSLANECLQRYGENELQDLIGKTLVRLECERQKITITDEEINAEVLRMAQTFGMTSEQWFQILEKERNISPEQYRQDIVWGIVALGKLAGPRLTVSDAELQEAYNAEFGPAVQARQIILASKTEAEAVLAELKQHPETFASIAKNKSIDPVSQAYGGMLRPIRRGTLGNPAIENILFALKPKEISAVLDFPAGHFTIFQCEGHLQPRDVDFEAAKQQLTLKIRDKKLQPVSQQIYNDLLKQAKIQKIFGNPALYAQYPGVAVLLDGKIITQQELAEVCLRKHGKEVLNDMMSWMLVDQACKREKIVITEQDIDNEIREMAFKHLPLKEDGSANVELWLNRAVEETGQSIPLYRKNVIVPMLSLKRLTRGQIQVTTDDVQRSFEANYGQKVRCLAIFFGPNDQRRAQEVWQKANQFKTEENFGSLAEQYSTDMNTRMGKGVIPPIARHCGQPVLEKAAFALKPGELSEIIQIEDNLAILYCLGSVEPLPVNIEEVKPDLVADIFDKKQQMYISQYFGKLYEQAAFDNYLTGESQNPSLEKAMREQSDKQR